MKTNPMPDGESADNLSNAVCGSCRSVTYHKSQSSLGGDAGTSLPRINFVPHGTVRKES